jgi:RNA polymerase sigma factor (sigma-70 family)
MSTLTDYAESIEETIIKQEDYDELYKQLNRLPAEQKLIVELKAEGDTVKEISNKTGLTESAVKCRFAKAQTTLSQRLKAA